MFIELKKKGHSNRAGGLRVRVETRRTGGKESTETGCGEGVLFTGKKYGFIRSTLVAPKLTLLSRRSTIKVEGEIRSIKRHGP